MKIFRKILLTSFIAIVSGGAAEVIAPGDSCAVLGATTMSTDQASIVACLKNKANGKLYWKSTSDAETPSGTLCGLSHLVLIHGVAIDGAQRNTSSHYTIVHAVKCKGEYIMSTPAQKPSHLPQFGGVTSNCPVGYTLSNSNIAYAVKTSNPNASTGSDVTNYFCVKD